MVSKTKFTVDNDKIKELFAKAGIYSITNISPLGAGEYNAVSGKIFFKSAFRVRNGE